MTTNSTIEIKVLSEQDAASYKKLRLFSFLESPLTFSESYEDECERSESDYAAELKQYGNPIERFVLGAFANSKELVGIVTFERDQRTKARHKSMIYAMYVHPEHREQGIGHTLLDKTIKLSKEIKGLEQIHLWVLHSGTSATGFYIKAGFETQGTLVKKDLKIGDVYVDAAYMVLYLNVH